MSADSSRTPLWKTALVVAGLCVAWALSSAATLIRYVPDHAGLLLLAGCVLVAAIYTAVFNLCAGGKDVPRWVTLVPCGILLLAYLMIYPHTQHLGPGRGSDREDALRVELKAIKEGVYPYSVLTYLGDHPTPLPGAVLLAAPFYWAGRVSLQNIVWVTLFTAACMRLFRKRCTTGALLLVFLTFSLEGLNDYVAGGDYVVNALYVAVAVFIVDRSLCASGRVLQQSAAFILLGICLASRASYLPALLPVFALSRQRLGWKRALALCGLSVLAIAAVTLPVFLPHPAEKIMAYSQQIRGKLRELPPWLPPSALQAGALLTSAASLIFSMSLRCTYLWIAASMSVLIAPPILTLVVADAHRGLPLTHQMVYFTAPAIFYALWASSWLEQKALLRTGTTLPVLP